MRKLVLICCLSLFCGCAAYQPPAKRSFSKSATVRKTFDETWSRLIAWFAENNSPIKNMEKVSGVITTERNLTVKDTMYCDCGKPGWAMFLNRSAGNMNVTVTKIDETNTKVTVNTFFTCEWSTMQGYTVVPAGSTPGETTGALEAEIFKAIAQ